MRIKGIQRGATRNQSTVDYTITDMFLYQNRYSEAILKNDTGGTVVFTDGYLVLRDTTTTTQVTPAISGNTLANVIGVLRADDVSLLNNGVAPVNICIGGDIDATMLKLPAGVTLETVVGGKCLKDVLTDLGFVLRNVTENSKINN